MSLYIYINDLSGNAVNDVSRGIDQAVNLRFETLWPKGYGVCSFDVRRDIAQQWAVKGAYEVIIRDEHKIIYQGLINNINKALQGVNENINVDAYGYYSLLARRVVRKRWVDNAPLERMYIPDSRLAAEDQARLNSDIRNNVNRILLPGNDGGTNGEEVWWQYDTVSGDVIDRCTYDVNMLSADGILLRLYNVANAQIELTTQTGTGSQFTDSIDHTLTRGDTVSIYMIHRLGATDADYEGYSMFYNMVVYVNYDSAHPDNGGENYFADEIIQDCLIKAVSEISTDYVSMVSPGLALIPFATSRDDYEQIDRIVQRALSYGDGADTTYGFSVWDEQGTSDSKPRPELIARPGVDDYEYEVLLGELTSFSDEASLDELYNTIHISYTSEQGFSAFVSGESTAALTDASSVTTYGRRDKFIRIGKSTAANATEYGSRYLALHKDPLKKSRLSIRGQIRNKGGVWVPASFVRAGKRVRVMDYDGGTTYLLRRTDYNADTQELIMEPDLTPDNISMITAGQSLGLTKITPTPPDW